MFLKTFILVLLSTSCKLIAGYDTHRRSSNVSSDATYLSAVYYVNWAIYDRKFNPQQLPVDKLTHVLYAFANISPTGEVFLSDTWADTQIHFPGDFSNEVGTDLYGCFKQLYLLKKANRNLKVLLSIGGWSYSANFAVPASTESGRSTFASTAVSLVMNLGLDGLDIDWEYPQDDTEAGNMVLLLQKIREELDTYGNSLNPPYHFLLTVACPAGPSHYRTLHLANMDSYVDFWNLMAYDYAGDWSSVAGNQANLFPSIMDPDSTPFNTNDTISNYTAKGILASKIILGMPLYGRSFADTDGLGKPFKADNSGSWQAGVYDYKALSLTPWLDTRTGSSYYYSETTRRLISYDSPSVAEQKAYWIQEMGLGGAMWWESSADRVDTDSLVARVVNILGGKDRSGLKISSNLLIYPNSTYDNIQAGMPDSSSASILASAVETSSLSSRSVLRSGRSSRPLSSSTIEERSSFLTSSATSAQFTTSTIHITRISTIISCASTVENCPAHSTALVTLTVPISTTVCPVTESSIESDSTIAITTSSRSGHESSSIGLVWSSSTGSSSILKPSSISTSAGLVWSSSIGSSSILELSSMSTATKALTSVPPQISTTGTLVVPGQDGVPGCAYILAADLGAGALCSLDYCNCGGIVAPLLTSTISGTLVPNCNYQTQPVTNSCSNPPVFVYTTTITLPTSPVHPTTVTSVSIVPVCSSMCSS